MTLASAITLTILIHILLVIFFPFGGKMLGPFIVVSAILWCAFFLFIRNALRSFQRQNAIFVDLFLLAVMTVSSMLLMPQKNHVPPLYKLIRGQYPDGRQLYIGLRHFGITCPMLLPVKKKAVEEEIRF